MISVWKYQPTQFTLIQQLGFLSFPISFLTLALGTLTWHFHEREIVLDNLKISEKIKSIPFFVAIITSKVWVMALFIDTLRLVLRDSEMWMYVAISTLVFLIIGFQLGLHLMMKFTTGRSVVGSLANLITLWRPSHDVEQEQKCLLFYRRETIMSSIVTTLLAVSNLIIVTFTPHLTVRWRDCSLPECNVSNS